MTTHGTAIEWTHIPGFKGESWNPLRAQNLATGGIGHFCEHVTEACRNCYAERIQSRFKNPIRYARQDRAQVRNFLDENTLLQPLRWKSPRAIFVCSMTDPFGEWVSDEWLHRILAVMALCPQHIFIALTKRPKRMQGYTFSNRTNGCGLDRVLGTEMREHYNRAVRGNLRIPVLALPLPNVWGGVSIHDQPSADAFIPDLLATPLSKRFVSYEPALGPVDFTEINVTDGHTKWLNALTGDVYIPGNCGESSQTFRAARPHLDWIICGGESGPNARPMDRSWAESARDQCKAAGIAFFMKQMTKKAPIPADLLVREFPDAT